MKTIFPGLGVLCVLAAGSALAASPTTGSFNVTASIQNNCTITSAANVAFGVVDPTGGGNLDVSANLVHRCTKGTAYTIALDDGAGIGGTFTARKMESAGANTDQLSYNLYTNAARTIVFGDGTLGSVTAGGTGSGISGAASNLTTTIYARLVQNEDVSVDSYSDTVAISITY